jgi:diguanylate cyclase
MAGRVDDYERTMAFADIALGQMKALRQPASPRNFEIWYVYASGYHPALNLQINATPKAKGKISEADLVLMHENFLSPTRLTESLTDPLTQLANRKSFDRTLEKSIAEALERNEAL